MWMQYADDQGYQLLSDSGVIQQVTSQLHEDTPEDETPEDDPEDCNVPSSGVVTEMLDKCLLWYEQQPESMATAVLLLNRVRDLAATQVPSELLFIDIDEIAHSYVSHLPVLPPSIFISKVQL